MHGYGFGNTHPPIVGPLSYDGFLERLNAKDRVNAQRHVALCEAGPDPRHAVMWRQLACDLMQLAGHSAKLNRQPPSAQFYTVDGKYRMQVFAIEDEQLGELRVYCGDALDRAVEEGLLVAQKDGDEVIGYRVSDSGDPLTIDRIDGASINSAVCFRDMVGWNRKAIRVTLSIGATVSQVEALKSLCALSIRRPVVPGPVVPGASEPAAV